MNNDMWSQVLRNATRRPTKHCNMRQVHNKAIRDADVRLGANTSATSESPPAMPPTPPVCKCKTQQSQAPTTHPAPLRAEFKSALRLNRGRSCSAPVWRRYRRLMGRRSGQLQRPRGRAVAKARSGHRVGEDSAILVAKGRKRKERVRF